MELFVWARSLFVLSGLFVIKVIFPLFGRTPSYSPLVSTAVTCVNHELHDLRPCSFVLVVVIGNL